MTKLQFALKPNRIKRITVNRHHIASNKKNGTRLPVLSIQLSRGTINSSAIRIQGPSEIIYSTKNPLKCGATVWIETLAPVEVLD